MKFKDQCDLCKKFSYCRGYENQVLCEECIEKKTLNASHKLLRRNYMNGIERIKILASEVKDKPLLKIIEYLLTRDDMDEKYLNEDKNLSQMIEFIKSSAQKDAKNGIAMIEDEVVYGWAIHYWDESNENLKLEKAKDETIEQKEVKKVKKPSAKKEWNPEGQLTLFDYM